MCIPNHYKHTDELTICTSKEILDLSKELVNEMSKMKEELAQRMESLQEVIDK